MNGALSISAAGARTAARPLRLAVIGAGWHAVHSHLPALAHYVAAHPGTVRLAGVCDLLRERAEAAARQFTIDGVFPDPGTMLAQVRPDACIVVTPVGATPGLAVELLARGIPVLMEKPFGANAEEARRVVEAAEAAGAVAMVSMNRRFDPAFLAARRWTNGRPVRRIEARMARRARRESNFLEGTGIHLVDAVHAMAGASAGWEAETRRVDGADWWTLELRLAGGAAARIELQPTAGEERERIVLHGDDFCVAAHGAYFDDGSLTAWEHDVCVLQERPAQGTPPCVADGTYAETARFVGALRGECAPYPTPREVLPALELCHAVATSRPQVA